MNCTSASERTAKQESEDRLSHLAEKAAEGIASKKDNNAVSVFRGPHHLERPPRYSWHKASRLLIFERVRRPELVHPSHRLESPKVSEEDGIFCSFLQTQDPSQTCRMLPRFTGFRSKWKQRSNRRTMLETHDAPMSTGNTNHAMRTHHGTL